MSKPVHRAGITAQCGLIRYEETSSTFRAGLISIPLSGVIMDKLRPNTH